jgi:hypothetical protein
LCGPQIFAAVFYAGAHKMGSFEKKPRVMKIAELLLVSLRHM